MQILAKLLVLGAVLLSTCFVNPEAARKEAKPDQNIPEASNDPTKETKDREKIEVVGVNDGDTLTVLFNENKKQKKIRLATIDAPEYFQPFGKKSRQSLSDQVFRKEITIRKLGNDRYGRIIAEVFVDGKNVNVEQIKRGFAWHYKRHSNQQTFKEKLVYSQAEKHAKENRLGVWKLDNPIPPWIYRKQNPRKKDNLRKSELTGQEYE